MPAIIPLLLAVVAAGANVAGGAIVTFKHWTLPSLRYFLAVGSGFMLGAIFLEMLPESISLNPAAPFWVLVGYLVVHLFEHIVASHLHFGEETHHEEMIDRRVGMSALVGLLVHTFFDGVAIGAGFGVSSRTGTLIFLAVLLHKIPDGFTAASIALTSGLSRRMAFGATVLLGLSTVGGVLAVLVTGNSATYALPVSAGATLYVAASDLMPEVNKEPGARLSLLVLGGTALFLLAETLAG